MDGPGGFGVRTLLASLRVHLILVQNDPLLRDTPATIGSYYTRDNGLMTDSAFNYSRNSPVKPQPWFYMHQIR